MAELRRIEFADPSARPDGGRHPPDTGFDLQLLDRVGVRNQREDEPFVQAHSGRTEISQSAEPVQIDEPRAIFTARIDQRVEISVDPHRVHPPRVVRA